MSFESPRLSELAKRTSAKEAAAARFEASMKKARAGRAAIIDAAQTGSERLLRPAAEQVCLLGCMEKNICIENGYMYFYIF